jgi:rhodanese-related sulfurtransferase
MPQQIDPQEAHDRLEKEPGSIYLDVRSVMEFEQGHPTGAWNIPILHATTAGMRQNTDFLRVTTKVLPKDTLVVVGCKSGQRSNMACQVLHEAGFTNVVNLSTGFHGNFAPGWAQCGLPATAASTPGKSWEELEAQE